MKVTDMCIEPMAWQVAESTVNKKERQTRNSSTQS